MMNSAAPAIKALHLSHCPLDLTALEQIAAAVRQTTEAGLRRVTDIVNPHAFDRTAT